jgi:hypothetical protein
MHRTAKQYTGWTIEIMEGERAVVIAEFERSMIVKRVRAGRLSDAPECCQRRIRDALATPGRPGFHKIAAQFGVATGTVPRVHPNHCVLWRAPARHRSAPYERRTRGQNKYGPA